MDRLLLVVRQPLRAGSTASVDGAATAVASRVPTLVRWPIGDTGALTIFSEKPFWLICAMSNTLKPPSPSAM